MDVRYNKKKFNIYVFLTTFARGLIEVFIPAILYNSGYSLKEVIIYYLFVNIFSLVLNFIASYIINKVGVKVLSIIAVFAFVAMQICLGKIVYGFGYMLVVAFLFATYRRFYWIPRRYYNICVTKEKNVSITYAFISIINQLGVILSTYIGSFLLDFIDIKLVTTISTILFIIGLIPLCKLNMDKRKEKFKLYETLKSIPLRNVYLFGSYELLNVLKLLFSLYLIIYVNNSYRTIGIISLISNISVILFTYFYGKHINTNKNYLNLSIFISCIIYLLKANVISWWLIPICFLESIFMKMHDISLNKEFYSSSKKYEPASYALVYDFIENFMRLCVVSILLFFNNLRVMIFIVIFFILIGGFINFKKK